METTVNGQIEWFQGRKYKGSGGGWCFCGGAGLRRGHPIPKDGSQLCKSCYRGRFLDLVVDGEAGKNADSKSGGRVEVKLVERGHPKLNLKQQGMP